MEVGRVSRPAGPTSPTRQPKAETDGSTSAEPSLSKGDEQADEIEDESRGNGKIEVKGVGIIRAHEAINILDRIPRNDPFRARAFQIVMDWLNRASRDERTTANPRRSRQR